MKCSWIEWNVMKSNWFNWSKTDIVPGCTAFPSIFAAEYFLLYLYCIIILLSTKMFNFWALTRWRSSSAWGQAGGSVLRSRDLDGGCSGLRETRVSGACDEARRRSRWNQVDVRRRLTNVELTNINGKSLFQSRYSPSFRRTLQNKDASCSFWGGGGGG